MRRLFPLLCLTLLAAAPPAARPPVPQPGTVIRAIEYGVDGKPTTEVSAKLEAIVAPLPDTANVVIELPPGMHYFGRSFEITKHGVTLRGAGERVTTLQAAGPFPALKVGRGFRDAAMDGFAFSAAGRPDLYGLADATLAPAPGQAWGFDTQTRTVLYSSGLGLDLGKFDADWGWDYWAAKGGFTVEGLVKGSYSPGASLCGIGTTTDPAGFGVLVRNSQQTGALTWFVAFDDDAEGVAHAATFDTGSWPATLRFRLWYDAAAGEVGLWANGKLYTPSWYGVAPKLAGRPLRLNRKGLPFNLGAASQDLPAGPVPQAVWGGLRVSSVPRREAPGPDSQLAADGPGVVAFLATADRPVPGRREVAVREGQAAQPGQTGVALALDTVTDLGPVTGTTLEDMTVTGAAPAVLLLNTFEDRVRRFSARGGRRGIGCVRYGCNYTLSLEDTTLEGSADSLNLYATFGLARNTNLNSGGITSAALAGSGLEWDGVLFSPQTHFPETAVSSFGNVDYDYTNTFRGVRLDNEVSPYTVANFYAETVPGGAASLTVEGGVGSWVVSGAPVFRLFGRAENKPGRLKVSAFDFPPGDAPAVLVTGPKGRWTGTVDLPGLRVPRQASGGGGFDPAAMLVR